MYPKYIQWMSDFPREQSLTKSKMVEELSRMRDIDFSKCVRVQNRKSTQQGIKNRRLIEDPVQNKEEETKNNGDELHEILRILKEDVEKIKVHLGIE